MTGLPLCATVNGRRDVDLTIFRNGEPDPQAMVALKKVGDFEEAGGDFFTRRIGAAADLAALNAIALYNGSGNSQLSRSSLQALITPNSGPVRCPGR